MTKEEKSEIKFRMKRLARKFCRRNDVYRSFDDSVGKLVEKSYLSAYLLCLHENKNKIAELEKENAELKKQQFSLRNERNTFFAQNEQYEKDLIDFNEHLTKAKELLHLFLDADTPLDMINAQRKAEQFLNSEA